MAKTRKQDYLDVIIDDDYFIRIDSYNHTLYERTDRVDRKGNPVNKSLGYYVNVAHAVKSLTEHIVLNRNNKLVLEDYIVALKRENDRILEALDWEED